MVSGRLPKPPEDLSEGAAAFWTSIVSGFMLEAHHLQILGEACRCWDRLAEARADVAKNGLVYLDRFQQKRANPAAELEVKYQRQMKSLLRELQLDVEPADKGFDRAPRLSKSGRASR